MNAFLPVVPEYLLSGNRGRRMREYFNGKVKQHWHVQFFGNCNRFLANFSRRLPLLFFFNILLKKTHWINQLYFAIFVTHSRRMVKTR